MQTSVVVAACALSLGVGTLAGQELPGERPGIPIVENEAPMWSAGRGWHLSEQPLLDIGVLEGDTNYQFYRISSVVRLKDGRIVVADGGNYRLKFFDGSGRFLGSTGRKGGGPGEFGGLGWVRQLDTDTLMAWDYRNRRLSFFSPGGDYVRSVRLEAPEGKTPNVIRAWSDGSVLASITVRANEVRASEVIRDSLLYVRYASDGRVADTLGHYPGYASYEVASRSGHNLQTTGVALPFRRGPNVTLATDGFLFGTGDSYAIGKYTWNGTLRMVLRCGQGNKPVTSEAIARYKEEMLRSVGNVDVRRTFERAWSEVPFPKTMPAYQSLFMDDVGNLWARDYSAPGETNPGWQVFDQEGTWLGRVSAIPGFTPGEIGADFALGVWKDDMGVEHVRLYRLVKP